MYVLTQERFLDIPAERFAGTDFFAIDEFYKLDDSAARRALGPAEPGVPPAPRHRGPVLPARPQRRRPGPQRARAGSSSSSSGPATRQSPSTPSSTRRAGHDLRELVTARCAALSGPTVLYASSPARAREIARWLLDARLGRGDSTLDDAASWIAHSYHPQWLVARAVRNGIGIHHGRMPRALAHHIVRLFNEGRLPWLIVTSTLIEGVNTIAKNIVIVDNKIGPRKLDFFTYSNIRGRSGRMFRHFVGKVIVYGEAPQRESQDRRRPGLQPGQGTPQPAHPAAMERAHRSIAPAPPALLPAAARQRKYPAGRFRHRPGGDRRGGPHAARGPPGVVRTSRLDRLAALRAAAGSLRGSSSSCQASNTTAAWPPMTNSPRASTSSASTRARSGP